ncbi:MAG: TolC family protein [Maribacter sp.]|nr:TolC family protein [Maribacter sp.]
MKHFSNKPNILILLLVLPLWTFAQETITLDKCFDLVAENYPLAKQTLLLNEQMVLDIEAINKGKLPKLDLNAQASYQSDVTYLPLQTAIATIVPPNKDQYKAALDVNQIIFDGGMIAASTKVKEASYRVRQQKIHVNLYALKHKINQLYHSILLVQEKLALLKAKENLLKAQLKEVEAGVKYGTLLSSSADVLEVELLKIKRQFTELNYSKSSLLGQLSLLIGKELNQNTLLQEHVSLSGTYEKSQRPELLFFDLQKEQIDFSTALLSKSNLPKINAFAQGGYGNPGLNMLENSFKSFYITGLRMNWKVFDWKKNKTEKQALQINKDMVNSQKEIFELNINLELENLQSEIDKLRETIDLDHEIIVLRAGILKSAESQLKNGAITSSNYMIEFTHLFSAKSDLNLHQTELFLKKIQYRITKGNYTTNKN